MNSCESLESDFCWWNCKLYSVFFYNSDSGSSFFISGSRSLTGKPLQLKGIQERNSWLSEMRKLFKDIYGFKTWKISKVWEPYLSAVWKYWLNEFQGLSMFFPFCVCKNKYATLSKTFVRSKKNVALILVSKHNILAAKSEPKWTFKCPNRTLIQSGFCDKMIDCVQINRLCSASL